MNNRLVNTGKWGRI